MSRPPLDVSSRLPLPVQQRYAECAAQGCGREPRSFSRFCTLHARNFHRTRDPNGRVIRLREIKSYLQLAELYLQRSAEHPAVKAAEEFLQINLRDPTMPRDIRKQMQRLERDGATPRAMLINFLGVWGLRHYLPHTVTTDACEALNIGSRVLRTCSLPTITTKSGTRNPVRLPARVSQAYGLMLRQALGFFATQFWNHVQSELEAPVRAATAVSKALRDTPFQASTTIQRTQHDKPPTLHALSEVE